jgi:hypothetical protein
VSWWKPVEDPGTRPPRFRVAVTAQIVTAAAVAAGARPAAAAAKPGDLAGAAGAAGAAAGLAVRQALAAAGAAEDAGDRRAVGSVRASAAARTARRHRASAVRAVAATVAGGDDQTVRQRVGAVAKIGRPSAATGNLPGAAALTWAAVAAAVPASAVAARSTKPVSTLAADIDLQRLAGRHRQRPLHPATQAARHSAERLAVGSAPRIDHDRLHPRPGP